MTLMKLFSSVDTMKAAEESATEETMKKEVTDTQWPYPGNDDHIGIII